MLPPRREGLALLGRLSTGGSERQQCVGTRSLAGLGRQRLPGRLPPLSHRPLHISRQLLWPLPASAAHLPCQQHLLAQKPLSTTPFQSTLKSLMRGSSAAWGVLLSRLTPGKKLNPKCHRVTRPGSRQASPGLWALSTSSLPWHYANYGLCCQPSVIDCSL